MIHKNKYHLREKYFVWAVILTILRFALQWSLPVLGISWSVADDMLMIEGAKNLLAGKWLGESYNHLTLNKNPGFPLFLALVKSANIPYTTATLILYISVLILIAKLLFRITENKKVTFVAYIYLLFSPIMFDANCVQRVYRMSIVPSVALGVVTACIGIFVYKHSSIQRQICWGILAGLFMGYWSIIREDSVWLLPFFICSLFITAVIYLKEGKAKRSIIVLVPLLLMFSIPFLIKTVNYQKYGLFATNDFKDTEFASVGKKILSIKPEEEKEKIWITHSTIEKLYANCPTFAKLRNSLEAEYNGTNQLLGELGDDGEIEKDYIIWCLRSAAANSGYYIDGKLTNTFWHQISKEIDAAFDAGHFEKRDCIVLSNLARPFHIYELKDILNNGGKEIIAAVQYDNLSPTWGESSGEQTALREVEAITNNLLIYPSVKKTSLDGYIFSLSETPIKMYLRNKNTSSLIDFENSPDVYEYYKEKGIVCDYAQNSRFYIQFDADELQNMIIDVMANDTTVYSYPLNQKLEDHRGNDFILHFGEINNSTVSDPIENYNGYVFRLISAITKLYQATGLIIVFITVFLFIRNICCSIKSKKLLKNTFFNWLYIIEIGVALSAVTNIMMVSFNYFDAYNRATSYQYLAGVYPLWQLFVIFVFIHKRYLQKEDI